MPGAPRPAAQAIRKHRARASLCSTAVTPAAGPVTAVAAATPVAAPAQAIATAAPRTRVVTQQHAAARAWRAAADRAWRCSGRDAGRAGRSPGRPRGAAHPAKPATPKPSKLAKAGKPAKVATAAKPDKAAKPSPHVLADAKPPKKPAAAHDHIPSLRADGGRQQAVGLQRRRERRAGLGRVTTRTISKSTRSLELRSIAPSSARSLHSMT